MALVPTEPNLAHIVLSLAFHYLSPVNEFPTCDKLNGSPNWLRKSRRGKMKNARFLLPRVLIRQSHVTDWATSWHDAKPLNQSLGHHRWMMFGHQMLKKWDGMYSFQTSACFDRRLSAIPLKSGDWNEKSTQHELCAFVVFGARWPRSFSIKIIWLAQFLSKLCSLAWCCNLKQDCRQPIISPLFEFVFRTRTGWPITLKTHLSIAELQTSANFAIFSYLLQ